MAALAAALIGACQCASSPASAPQPADLGAQELAIMMTAEPRRAMALLWESPALQANSDVSTWCLHQIGVAEPGQCRALLVEHAGVLLDTSELGSPEDVVALLLGDAEKPAADDFIEALAPVLQRQFAGGRAERLGRTLHALQIRRSQENSAR